MAFIDDVIQRAQACPDTVVLLPEAEDVRTIKAADEIEETGIAHVVLLGDPDQVAAHKRELGISREFEVVNPASAPHLDAYTEAFYEMRKAKGVTPEQAREFMSKPIPHGVMMLHQGTGHGLVAGACHSTADTLRPALQILRTAPGCSLVSSFFFMSTDAWTYLFADCGLVENPDAEQLAEIALSTARSAIAFGMDPHVAMISYSTKGSAKSELTEKVVRATEIAQKRASEQFKPGDGVIIDGELQVDAAIVPKVAASKAPGSPLEGKARILIFPDLDAGNSAYKLVQRLAGAEAYGPIIQGMRLPVNDLSRGCSASDIVGVSAITVLQGEMARKAL
jgi:phosphate acetyltransferase